MNQKSFTLIEVLTVILVVGVISSFVLVGTTSVTEQATVAKDKSFSNSLENSLLTSKISDWKFDEGTGTTITADSWLTNNFSFPGGSNNPTWLPSSECISGTCLYFDGEQNQYLIKEDLTMNIINGFTFEGFINLDSINNDSQLLNYGFAAGDVSSPRSAISAYYGNLYGEFIEIDYGYYSNPTWYAVYCTANDTIFPLNRWVHFVMSLNPRNTNGKIYIDGQAKQNYTAFGNGGAPANYQSLITYDMFLGYAINGKLDNVKVYNFEASEKQIKQSYYSGLIKLARSNKITKQELDEKLATIKK